MRNGIVKIRKTIDLEVEGIGKRIQEARKASPHSLEKLAGEAGISRVYWYDIEGERLRDALPEATLRNIERALGVDFGVHFERDKAPQGSAHRRAENPGVGERSVRRAKAVSPTIPPKMGNLKAAQIKDQVLAVLKDFGEPLEVEAVTKTLNGPSKATVTNILKELAQEGRVSQRKQEGQTLWEVTPES